MGANGLEGCAHGSAVERCDHVEKEQQFRAHRCLGAQSAIRRAPVEGFTQQVEQESQVVVERHGLRTVVYTTAADNSRSTRTRYNALIAPLSVEALPWYQPSFSTTSGSSLWCGSSSCSTGRARTPPPSDTSRS